MTTPPPRLLQIRTGPVRRVGKHRTAYGKDQQEGPVAAHALGLDGDEVGDTRVHGGPEKAVYAYGAPAYPLWLADHPEHQDKLVPGAFGENLLIEGLDEETVHIGDQYRIGTAVVEVCQPRQPCSTLARWFDDPKMVKAMVSNGRSGWYLRVIEDGRMQAGDAVTLEYRPEGAWSIAAVLKASYRSPPNVDELQTLANIPGLAASWAEWAEKMAKSAKPKAKPL